MDALSGLHETASEPRRRRRRRFRYRLTGRFWFLVMLFVVLNAATQFGIQAWKVREYHRRIAEATDMLERLEAENEALRSHLEYVHTDSYIEVRAREQGYVYPHETAVVLAEPRAGGDVERRTGANPTPGY